MAAPTNLRRDDFPCQLGAVHTWPISDVPAASANVCRPPALDSLRKKVARTGLTVDLHLIQIKRRRLAVWFCWFPGEIHDLAW